MRKVVFCTLSIVLAFLSSGIEARAQALQIRAMTYNIKHTAYRAADGPDKIAQVIADAQATIVGLQETSRASAEAIRGRLQTLTGRTWYATATQETGTGTEIFDAVVSTYPIVGTTHITMYSVNDKYSDIRAALLATVEVPDAAGQPHRLQFFVTHLSTREQLDTSIPSPRARQVDELMAFVKAFPSPQILVGDFNLDPAYSSADVPLYEKITGSTQGGFTDSFRQIHPTAAGKTLPAPNPIKRYDYVFYKKSTGFNAVASEIIINASTDAYSDHYPVYADFVWDGATWGAPLIGEPLGSGSAQREHWSGITGSAIGDLTGHASYPGSPSRIDTLSWYVQTPFDSANDYGQRIRGYLTAPESGSYLFWVASNNESELWLSTDDDPANKRRIAWIKANTTLSAEWSKYEETTGDPNLKQRSDPVTLSAGRLYYFEVLHKEGTGPDALGVGWKLPGGLYERPIHAKRLSRYIEGNRPPRIDVAATATPNPAQVGQTVTLSISASDPDGDVPACVWDFGDGSPQATGCSVTHAYAAAGNHAARVTVSDGANSVPRSTAVTVGSSSTWPAPWQRADVGAVELAGSASYANGTFTVRGGGTDIWAGADAFHFVYQTLTGDGEIVARVGGITNPAGANWSLAAVTMREQLAADSIHASMMITSDGKAKFRRRTTVGGTTASDGPSAGTTYPPRWLKLVRSGDTFTASISNDGVAWTQVHTPQTIPMAATIHVGMLALRNGSSTGTCAATFDNVAVRRLPSPWQSADVGNVGVAGSAASASGTLTVQGGGTDLWANEDAFHYVYQPLSGDGEIVAELAGLANPTGASWSLAAVTIREKLTAGSIHASMMITTDGKAKFRRRTVEGGTTASDGPSAGTTYPPRWLRLTRTGDVFRAYISTDGAIWSEVHTAQTIPMAADVSIGLVALRNGSSAGTATATFRNITVVP